jgi:hypothetical protein
MIITTDFQNDQLPMLENVFLIMKIILLSSPFQELKLYANFLESLSSTSSSPQRSSPVLPRKTPESEFVCLLVCLAYLSNPAGAMHLCDLTVKRTSVSFGTMFYFFNV